MKKIIFAAMAAISLCASPLLLAEVNINSATASELESLSGIGEKKAAAIINYRSEYGAFKTLGEIKEVKGIGEGIFKKIKADISVTMPEKRSGKAGAGGSQGSEQKTKKTEKSEKTGKKLFAAAEKVKKKPAKQEKTEKTKLKADKEKTAKKD